jgi:hypothetical protein
MNNHHVKKNKRRKIKEYLPSGVELLFTLTHSKYNRLRSSQWHHIAYRWKEAEKIIQKMEINVYYSMIIEIQYN